VKAYSMQGAEQSLTTEMAAQMTLYTLEYAINRLHDVHVDPHLADLPRGCSPCSGCCRCQP